MIHIKCLKNRMEKLKRWYIGKEDKKYKWIKLDVSINPLIIKHLFNFFLRKRKEKKQTHLRYKNRNLEKNERENEKTAENERKQEKMKNEIKKTRKMKN